MEYLKTKCTKINNMFHVRLIDIRTSNVLDEMACELKQDIGYCCKEMLRWHDKLGGMSKMADKSRERFRNQPIGKIKYFNELKTREIK